MKDARGALVFGVLLLVAALGLFLFFPRHCAYEHFVTQRFGDAKRIEQLVGLPAFESKEGVVLFFEADGMSGRVEGAVIIKSDKIVEVVLTKSREGTGHDALSAEHLASYVGRDSQRPVVVDAVGGATVSSLILVSAINERIAAWRKATEPDNEKKPIRARETR